MLEGKISVKHYLNNKVADRNGELPVYILIRFQNKDSRIKSRWKFFDPGNLAIRSPLHVDQKYKDQEDYFSVKDFNDKLYQNLFATEAKAVIKVGDFFRKLDINFIEYEPSKIIDYSIVPIKDLLGSYYKFELERSVKLTGKYDFFYHWLVYNRNPSIEFGVIIRAMEEIARKDVRADFLNEWIKTESKLDQINSAFRVIDWLSDENKSKEIPGLSDQSFVKKFSTDINLALKAHYHSIVEALPKKITIDHILHLRDSGT